MAGVPPIVALTPRPLLLFLVASTFRLRGHGDGALLVDFDILGDRATAAPLGFSFGLVFGRWYWNDFRAGSDTWSENFFRQTVGILDFIKEGSRSAWLVGVASRFLLRGVGDGVLLGD